MKNNAFHALSSRISGANSIAEQTLGRIFVIVVVKLLEDEAAILSERERSTLNFERP